MSFLETPAFPVCPQFGSSGGPMYSTSITGTANAREFRNENWQYPLHKYEVQIRKNPTYMEQVLYFFHAVSGQFIGFRFKDFADYKSCSVVATPTGLDMPFAPGPTPGTNYQLIKRYTSGALYQDRLIQKPVSGTISVANAGGTTQAPGTYALDLTTGILTPNGGFSGVPTTWGGEFDVPCRFDMEYLPLTIENMNSDSAQVALIEIRLP